MNPARLIGVVLLTLQGHALAASATADAAFEARDWLQRMAVAMDQMSYQGTFVYVQDGNVQTMRITRVVDDRGARERLYAITGPRREVVRDEAGVRCVLEDRSSVLEDAAVSRSFFPGLPLTLVPRNQSPYELEMGGSARIARHVGRRVAVRPRDEFRYGYELWLEKHTGLLLKWTLVDHRGQAVAKLMFTELRMGAEVDESELAPQALPAEFVRARTRFPRQQMLTQDSPRWRPEPLPAGFRLTTHSHEGYGDDGLFEHLLYSDGLAAVSVYIEGGDRVDPHGVDGVVRLGTLHAYVRRVGPVQITVIGEVPEATVRAFGEAMAGTRPAP